jgi:hypothetical protein
MGAGVRNWCEELVGGSLEVWDKRERAALDLKTAAGTCCPGKRHDIVVVHTVRIGA